MLEGKRPRFAPVRVLASALMALTAAGCACGGEKNAPEWSPRPQVGWYFVSTTPVAPLSNEYRIVAPRPTKGLFPGNIAVTRVGLRRSGDGEQVRAVLTKDPLNEFLMWNRAFDDQFAISEAFPVDPIDLGGGRATPDQILRAFKALDAEVGLVYAVNEIAADETEMLGTLYDVQAGAPIAFIHTQALSLPVPEDTPEREIDLRATDSKAIVRDQFQQLVYGCLRELVLQDEPAEPQAPTGWQPVRADRSAAWPPPSQPGS